MSTKAEGAFRTISEVSEMLDVPSHVLRFWETKFNSLTPLKRNGGRRYYRPNDVDLLVQIRDLLYRDGYTIKGVQKLLSGGAVQAQTPDDVPTGGADLQKALEMLSEARADINRMKVALGAL